MGKQWSPEESKLINTWLRRHRGARKVAVGVTGEQRAASRRAQANACVLGGSWYVVETKAKGEHAALEALTDAGFEAYLPEYKIERYNRKRRVNIVSTLKVFPRYMFVKMDPVHLALVRQCDGVLDVLPGRQRDPEPVPAKDVDKLRRAQANMELDDTDEARKRRGETSQNTLKAMKKRLKNKTVRVADGPFAGFRAKVDVVHAIDRLRVLIDIFGRDTPVELEMGQIEELAA